MKDIILQQEDVKEIYSHVKYLEKLNIFGKNAEKLFTNHVWERPLRLHTANAVDLSQSVKMESLLDYKSLFANRILSYLYERDLVFLPSEKYSLSEGSFNTFYDTNSNKACALLKLYLEEYCLGFLTQEVQVSGHWTKKKFLEYYKERTKTETYPALDYLTKNKLGPLSAQILLIQHGLDFLVEASHMTKAIGGDFGSLQSEIFKVLIDEYG